MPPLAKAGSRTAIMTLCSSESGESSAVPSFSLAIVKPWRSPTR